MESSTSSSIDTPMIEVTKAPSNCCIDQPRKKRTLPHWKETAQRVGSCFKKKPSAGTVTRSRAENARGVALLLAGVILAFQTGAQTYSVEDLGLLSDIPGRNDSGPHGINRLGAVAAANVVNGSYRALLYNGTWMDLGTLGGSESLAAAVNALGRVVGYSLVATGSTNAFLWTPGGTGGV